MRKLTKREKALLAVVGIIGVIVLALQVLPAFVNGLVRSNKAAKFERLQTAENLVQLETQASGINDSLRGHVGLRGRLISDSLFDELSELHNVEAFNQTRRVSDLIALHPALEGKAASLLAYKSQRDSLAKLEELKTIQGSIFEGEQPRVVISQRISQLARKSGLRPDYQLNIKPPPGKKTEKISRQAKRNFVLYSYKVTLENELKRIKEEKEKSSQEQSDIESELERAMFEGWWGDSDTGTVGSSDSNEGVSQETKLVDDKEPGSQPTRSSVQEKAAAAAIDNDHPPDEALAKNQDSPGTDTRFAGGSSGFPPLPATIPIELRVTLIEFILSFVTLELNGAMEFKRGFIADQITRVDEPPSRRFAEFEPKSPAVRVRFREDSAILAKFEDLIGGYEATRINDPGASNDGILDYEEQIVALTKYIDSIDRRARHLQDSLAKAVLTYEPEMYGVEVKFKSDIRTVVKLIELIETSTKWLYVKNFKLTNDKSEKKEDEERARLNVELSMIARVL